MLRGRHLLLVRQRSYNVDAASGLVEEVERTVTRIRGAWPRVKLSHIALLAKWTFKRS